VLSLKETGGDHGVTKLCQNRLKNQDAALPSKKSVWLTKLSKKSLDQTWKKSLNESKA